MADADEMPAAEYDGPWKDALDFALDLFLQAFQPALHAATDWGHDYLPMAGELQRMVPAEEGKVRRLDALFRLAKPTGDPRYLHVEVQAFFDKEFGSRTMTYRHRLRDALGAPVVTVVVFADADPDWCPAGHAEGELGSEDTCTWLPVKLWAWRHRLAELEATPNPFGLFVAAHLEALTTRKDLGARRAAKVRLLGHLLGRGLDPADTAEWYRLLDWLLRLPRAMEPQLHEEVRQLHGDVSMQFMNYWEQQGLEKGMEKGMEKGREKGLQEGRAEGARKVLRALLQARFGAEGAALADHLGGDVEAGQIEQLAPAVLAAASLQDLRALFPNGATPKPPPG